MMSMEEEDVDKGATSWEARAEQLFSLCDREGKGFVTKRDLQRLWGEIPLGPDELEGVFDSLDQDQNGFLTLEEFMDGFGHHLGLVIEFRADTEVTGQDSEEEDNQVESEIERVSPASRQIDDILNQFAKHNFDISSAVIESIWRDVCKDSEDDNSGLEKLVVDLLQELARVKADHMQLEIALAGKTEQYNQQVARLYEELESQINGERSKADVEQSKKRTRAMAALEQEVRDRDAALKQLQEDQAALTERVERLIAAELTAKQDNVRLLQHLNKLEDELSRKEIEGQELTDALDRMKKSSKDEKILRAQRAMKVSEGIALERESLVTQLDLLRTINTQLRDEQDQTQPNQNENSTRSRGEEALGTGILKQDSSIPPVPLKRTSVSAGEISTSSSYSTFTEPTSLPLQPSDDQDREALTDSSQTSTEVEHDELYFQNCKMNTTNDHILPRLTTITTSTAAETNLMQELLQSPTLCSSCGGTTFGQPAIGIEKKPRVTFERKDFVKDSMTQTSPKMFPKEQLLTREVRTQPKSPDVVMPAQIFTEKSELITKFDSEKPTTSIDPDVTQNCSCNRDGKHSPHSTTLILQHIGKRTPPDLLTTHTSNTYIHTQHKHHFHTQLTVQSTKSQTTSTQSEQSHVLQDSEDVSPTKASQTQKSGHFCSDKESLASTYADQQENEDGTAKKVSSIVLINNYNENSEDGSDKDMGRRRLSRTTSSSLIEHTYDRIHDLKNLKDNIKSYINDKSQVFLKDNSYQCDENGYLGDVPKNLPNPSRIFKVVFIGDSGVGKTSFIHRASIGEYRGDFGSTVGVDYRLMEVVVGGVHALLQLWDTAGQERYRAITRQYYRKADGVVVMYDVTSERSFLSVADWISSVREYGDSKMVMAVIGNKKDLHKAKQVDIDVSSKLAKAHNSLMYECSAANGCGVQEAMKHLAALLTTDQQHDIDTSATLTLHRSPKSSNKCC